MGTRDVGAVNGYDPVLAGSTGDGLVINPALPLDSGGGFLPVLLGADPILKVAPGIAPTPVPAPVAAPAVPVAQPKSPRIAMGEAADVPRAGAAESPGAAERPVSSYAGSLVFLALVLGLFAFFSSRGER